MDPVRLSPVSAWEAMLLAERGRIRLDPDAATWVAHAAQIAGHVEAPLTFDVASASRSLDIATEDPADRFLVATALVHGLRLVTSDRVLFSLWTKSRGIRAAMPSSPGGGPA